MELDDEDDVMVEAKIENEDTGVIHATAMMDDRDEMDNQNAGEAEADADPIVREMDVYISHKLESMLYLLQFPNQSQSFDAIRTPKFGRFKEKSKSLELDLPLEQLGQNYNARAGEKFSEGLTDNALLTVYDRDILLGGARENSNILDNLTLASTKVVPVSHYYAGIIQDDQFHITKINSNIHMRPKLKYIDKIEEKKKASLQRIHNEERKEAGIEEQERLIQLKGGDKKSQLRREEVIESWTELKIHDVNSVSSKIYNDLLFSEYADFIYPDTSKSEYLNQLRPVVGTEKHLKDIKGKLKITTSLSRADVAEGTLEDKVKAILATAQVSSFSRIYEFLKDDGNVSEVDIVLELEKCAVLVNGVWVLKSEYLYIDRPAHARQYLLGMFLLNGTVNRLEFSKSVLLPVSMIGNMMLEVAVLNYETKKWKLKIEKEDYFVNKYPAVVSRQNAIVKENYEKAKIQMGLVKDPKEAIASLISDNNIKKESIPKPIVTSKGKTPRTTGKK